MKRLFLSALLCAMFLLGNHKGYLALWKEGSPEPYQVFPVAVASLPAADQTALEAGIPARSETELSSLLEDFLS